MPPTRSAYARPLSKTRTVFTRVRESLHPSAMELADPSWSTTCCVASPCGESPSGFTVTRCCGARSTRIIARPLPTLTLFIRGRFCCCVLAPIADRSWRRPQHIEVCCCLVTAAGSNPARVRLLACGRSPDADVKPSDIHGQQHPVLSCVLPVFLDHRLGGNFAESIPLIQPARACVAVRDYQAESGSAGRAGFVRCDVQQGLAVSLAAVFRVGGEHVHIPGAGDEFLELLQWHEHGRHADVVDRFGIALQRVSDQGGDNAAILLADGRIAIKALFLVTGPIAADIPGSLTGFGHSLPQVLGHAVAGHV